MEEHHVKTDLGVLDTLTGVELIDYGGDQMDRVQRTPEEVAAAVAAAPLANQVEVRS